MNDIATVNRLKIATERSVRCTKSNRFDIGPLIRQFMSTVVIVLYQAALLFIYQILRQVNSPRRI